MKDCTVRIMQNKKCVLWSVLLCCYWRISCANIWNVKRWAVRVMYKDYVLISVSEWRQDLRVFTVALWYCRSNVWQLPARGPRPAGSFTPGSQYFTLNVERQGDYKEWKHVTVVQFCQTFGAGIIFFKF